ncbi:MAG: DUF4150 domain-containing protein [Pseudomonadota bacterium]|nr:DUF4150 domain-containing protein [Pseudomonadota bacterium]
MGTTVNINGRSLTHKKSNGFSKSTLPDVCKTPSPGGPVPVPYPVIVSFSKDLVKGTKTIKVEGKMAANKGSQFKNCIGDEPGTVKGVKSNTHRKEAKWITSSPNVKLEGKAACRLGDKMFMNHGNTACLGGETQLSSKSKAFELNIDCDYKQNQSNPKWDECMMEELCQMVEDFNKIDSKSIHRKSPSPSSPKSSEYASYQAGLNEFSQRFEQAVNEGSQDEKWIRNQFSTECRYQKWCKGAPPPPRNPTPPRTGPNRLNPDHVHDAALGGPLGDIDGMKWVHGRVNGTVGACMRNKNYNPGDKVTTPSGCCDS